ncbi:cupin domain-containing protein [Kitasatospora sp. NBC_01287]|uniref:cupin domain-containing protein n=1 Tax=Kitasatospora sp. NBC_01287 TaxID=2903573 RepID=UPI002256FF4B|nr:cupin domain-containing protein [Kitasatospora sp. NBC_01287]MCX4745462.1 cupin domain-containing protein [Kitasatospora sp. NBC_01287]
MTLIDPTSAAPVLVRADEAELLGAPPATIQLLADGSDTSGALSAVRTRMGKGTAGPGPHLHHRAPEIFFVIEGALDVLLGEEIVTARDGDFLLVPPQTVHAFRTPADHGVDLLFLMPGTDRFEYFRLVERIRQGQASPQEILDTQERFDNHFVPSTLWESGADGGA